MKVYHEAMYKCRSVKPYLLLIKGKPPSATMEGKQSAKDGATAGTSSAKVQLTTIHAIMLQICNLLCRDVVSQST